MKFWISTIIPSMLILISSSELYDVTTIIRFDVPHMQHTKANSSRISAEYGNFAVTVHMRNNARGLPILLNDGTVLSANVGIDVEECSPFTGKCSWKSDHMILGNSDTAPLYPGNQSQRKFRTQTPFFPINTAFVFKFNATAEYGVMGIFLTKGNDKFYEKDMYYFYLRNGHETDIFQQNIHETSFLLRCSPGISSTSYELPANLGNRDCNILAKIDLANNFWNEVEQYTFKVTILDGHITLNVNSDDKNILQREFTDPNPLHVDHFSLGTVDMAGEFSVVHGNVWTLVATEGSLLSPAFHPTYSKACIAVTFYRDSRSSINVKLVSSQGESVDFIHTESITLPNEWKTAIYLAELPYNMATSPVQVKLTAVSFITNGLLIQRIAGCNARGSEDTTVLPITDFTEFPADGFDVAVDRKNKWSGGAYLPTRRIHYFTAEPTTELISGRGSNQGSKFSELDSLNRDNVNVLSPWEAQGPNSFDSGDDYYQTEPAYTTETTTSDYYDAEIFSSTEVSQEAQGTHDIAIHLRPEICLNGGIFIKELGICVCPAGFIGSTCERGCGMNKYGSKCDGRCSKTQNGCKAMKLCRPKVGCNCAPGLKGSYCETECEAGAYGIDCQETCGFCSSDEPCDKYTGLCLQGCADGYYPPYCREEYSYVAAAPEIHAVDFKSIILTANLKREKMNGRGNPRFYQFQYKVKASTKWIDLEPEEMVYKEVEVAIPGLEPGISYEARIVILDEDGSSYRGKNLPILEVKTKCSIPTDIQYDLHLVHATESSFVVEWNVSFTFRGKLSCKITHYEVEVNEDWRWKQQYQGPNKSIAFTDMLPGQEYEVRVRAITAGGPAKYSDILKVATRDKDPEEVFDFRLVSTNYNELKLEWTPPLETAGTIRYYSVSYECRQLLACTEEDCSPSSGHLEVKDTSAVIQGLLPHAQYAVSVAAVAGTRGPDLQILAVTDMTEPYIAPVASPGSAVSQKTNSSFTVHWDPPHDCTLLNGYLYGYRYELLTEDNSESIRKNTTKSTSADFTNLTPFTEYVVKVFLQTSGGWNSQLFLEIPAKTRATVPGPVQQLVVYKRDRRMLGLRWGLPKNMYGSLKSFTITSTTKGTKTVKSEVEPTICDAWPNLYCFTFGSLRPNAEHILTVQARNNEVDEDGQEVTVYAVTKDDAPEPPTGLRVKSQNETSLTIEWGIPEMLNGRLKSFLIAIQQIDAFEPSKCCVDYNVYDMKVSKEKPTYVYEATFLRPASTYSISVSAKTVLIGNNSMIRGHTKPSIPSMDRMVEIKGNTNSMPSSFTVWIHPSSENKDLIRGYLLVVLPQSRNIYYEKTTVWREWLMEDLAAHFNGSYYIAKEFEQAELEKNSKTLIGTGNDEKSGVWGELRDPVLQAEGEYRLGVVIILEYNGIYNLGYKETETFSIEDL